MPRLILFLLLAVAVAAAAGWFAMAPGQVSLTFRGWQVETTVGVLVLAVAALVIAALAVFALVAKLLAAPRRYRAWRSRRRADKGLKALARGMVAVAAGDAATASREARRADRLMDAAPLTLLLSAQAAQLEGDETAAETYFREMLARPETEFLGLRGLLLQAGRAGDSAAALAYAGRAAELRPESSWVQRSLFELSVKAGLWADAERALRRAVRRGAIDRETGARHRAALYLQQSADAERRNFGDEARNLARKARRAAPDFVPAALRLAILERDSGRKRAARRALERAWRAAPHPELAAVYGSLFPAAGDSEEAAALARVKGIRRLVDIHPGHPEGHLAMVEAALAAKLWGEARSHLEKARQHFEGRGAAEPPPARLYRLYARSEEEEKGDSAAAARWLGLAGEAAADACWLCGECGHGYATWVAICPGCQGFDTLAWDRPEPIVRIAAVSGAPANRPPDAGAAASARTLDAPDGPREGARP
ncbi:MAG: heme biosynthesis HemY N-terminal domain-containing protein [Alphaproteobacteria bacterium]|nr:heme biosynthesis HemY N-terminal domain-containing protein [Alphaproteobacteria bacterium]